MGLRRFDGGVEPFDKVCEPLRKLGPDRQGEVGLQCGPEVLADLRADIDDVYAAIGLSCGKAIVHRFRASKFRASLESLKSERSRN